MQNSNRKLIICIAVILLFNISYVYAQESAISIETIKAIGLKVIDIKTTDNEEPTCEFAEAPEGSMGMTIVNETKVPCRVIITLMNDTLYDSGEYIKSASGATIKISGNTTAFYSQDENYPYKIKLQKKGNLLCNNDKKYEDKDWRLLKDAVSLNTIIGFKVNELIGLSWTPKYTPCNVFMNGDYRGCYLLVESVKRNKDCRINVSKDNGYIVERDAYWWKESKYFATNYFENSKSYRWTWKYPDEEDVTQEQEDYIRAYINQAEESIINGTYNNYIDCGSFAKWILAHDILGTKDSGGSNLYVSKYDENSLLEMPNLWDFDSNFCMDINEFSAYHYRDYDFYFPRLFNNSNNEFRNRYKELWNSINSTLSDNIVNFVREYVNSDEGKKLQASREYHIKRWNFWKKTTVEDDANEAISWLVPHIIAMDKLINNTDRISDITDKKTTDSRIYILSGLRIDKPKKGLYIKNNKVYYNKNAGD